MPSTSFAITPIVAITLPQVAKMKLPPDLRVREQEIIKQHEVGKMSGRTFETNFMPYSCTRSSCLQPADILCLCYQANYMCALSYSHIRSMTALSLLSKRSGNGWPRRQKPRKSAGSRWHCRRVICCSGRHCPFMRRRLCHPGCANDRCTRSCSPT